MSDDSPPMKRRKRTAYALIACTLCKTRKVKCEGALPCQRCQQYGLECVYPTRRLAQTTPSAPSSGPETRVTPKVEAAVERIEHHLEYLTALMNVSRASSDCRPPRQGSNTIQDGNHGAGGGRPISRRDQELPMHPISFVYSFDVAKSNLETKGFPLSPELRRPQEPRNGNNPESQSISKAELLHSASPIMELGEERCMRLLTLLQETVYDMYPCFDFTAANRTVSELFRLGFSWPERGHPLDNRNTLTTKRLDIIKGLLALALRIDDAEQDFLLWNLESNISWSMDLCSIHAKPDMDDVLMAALMSIYFMHRDEPLKAWRVMGFAARSALELGLHQRSAYPRDDPNQILFRKVLLATMYSIDHASGVSTGLPFSFQDHIIDETCLDIESSHPFLGRNTAYDRLLTELYNLNNTSSLNTPGNTGRMEFLGMKIDRILKTMPAERQWDPSQLNPCLSTNVRAHLSLNGFLYVRGHHLKIILNARDLFTSKDPQRAGNAEVNVLNSAKEIISVCTEIVHNLGTVPGLRGLFNYFLVSSLAALFLSVSRNPQTHAAEARDAFHAAISTLTASPCQVYMPQKLWCSFDDLKTIGARLGMSLPDPAPVDGYDRSADAMQAGIMQRPIDEICLTNQDLMEYFNIENILNQFGSDAFPNSAYCNGF